MCVCVRVCVCLYYIYSTRFKLNIKTETSIAYNTFLSLSSSLSLSLSLRIQNSYQNKSLQVGKITEGMFLGCVAYHAIWDHPQVLLSLSQDSQREEKPAYPPPPLQLVLLCHRQGNAGHVAHEQRRSGDRS